LPTSHLTQTQKIEFYLLKWKIDHLVFWLIYALFYGFLFPLGDSIGTSFLIGLVILIFHAIVAYFNNDYLIPRLLLPKSYVLYIFSLGLSIISVCFPLSIAVHLLIMNSELQTLIWSDSFFLFLVVNVLFTVITTMVLKLIKQWYKDQKMTAELRREQLQTELKFLKSQINPHFLFNSLNNLYALTLSKSDSAPEVVLRLSNILRYILYESSEGAVSVSKEMQHVNDYVAIERLRLGDTVRIDVDIDKNINDELIEPMLFLTLVENAFKHSENVLPEKRFIKIHAKSLQSGFRFLIENTFNPSKKNQELGGIGLVNIKKRLNLIYPNNHDLKSSTSDGVYRVDLIINW
jgi:two-component system, LytTR family, sensor kinase